MFRYLPEQASTFAPDVDWIHHWITDISVFFTFAIFGAAVLFTIIWRRRGGKDHQTPQITGDHRLEAVWTIVPTIICIFVAVEGLIVYRDLRTPPSATLDISATAEQFAWYFDYPNGKRTTNEITVPVGEAVKFTMRSKDVIHSFFVPAMRVKSDVLPNMYTHVWFEPVKTGSYTGFCTEYCGSGHSAMMFKVNVVSPAEYERWLNDDSQEFMMGRMGASEKGMALFQVHNCHTCHSIDGTRKIGPTMAGLFGMTEKLADGSEVVVDENYLEESILNPNAKIVAGYAPLMPAYEALLSVEDVTALIAYIKSLETTEQVVADSVSADPVVEQVDRSTLTPEERGKLHYQEKACNACHSLDGTAVVGPSFKGVYGRTQKFTDGSEAVVDEAYIKNSILKPADKIVDGFPPSMPSYEGQLTDDDISDIIAFMKSLK